MSVLQEILQRSGLLLLRCSLTLFYMDKLFWFYMPMKADCASAVMTVYEIMCRTFDGEELNPTDVIVQVNKCISLLH